MAININDLDNNLQPVGASLLSGNDSIMDNLRELSDEELKASGGSKGSSFFFSGGGLGGGSTFFNGGGKKGGGFFFSQPAAPVAQQPVFAPAPVATGFPVSTGFPVATGVPVATGFPVGVGGVPVGGGDLSLTFNVNPIALSNSRANAGNLFLP